MCIPIVYFNIKELCPSSVQRNMCFLSLSNEPTLFRYTTLSKRRLYWRLSDFCETEIDLKIPPNKQRSHYSCTKQHIHPHPMYMYLNRHAFSHPVQPTINPFIFTPNHHSICPTAAEFGGIKPHNCLGS
jgi:hypothetical protein